MTHPIDFVGALWFLTLFVGTPLIGWAFAALDYRAYLRSLRRQMIAVRGYAARAPLWALRERPECLGELGLQPGCSEQEVMAAYRHRVLTVHPDRGGDRRQFDRLQRHLKEALTLVANKGPTTPHPPGP